MTEDRRVDSGELTHLDAPTMDRRRFLKLLGGGVIVSFTVSIPADLLAQRRGDGGYPEDFNAYLRVGEDGRISIFTGKIEMGQGVFTSLAMMAAEELNVPLESIDMVMGDTLLCPWDRGTFGSRSTPYFGPALRRAAAEARAVLTEMASERLGSPHDELTVENGVIYDRRAPEKRATYAELAQGRRIDRHLEGEAPLERYSDFDTSGRPTPRIDARAKVTGEAKYTGDIRMPGMMYASILRPPSHDSERKSLDLQAARQVRGVRIIQDGDLVAALHEKPDLAMRARDLIEAVYETPEADLDPDNIFEHLLREAPEAEVVAENGNLDEGRQIALRSFDSTFYNHYVAHAPMEPHTACVRIDGNGATVWASTQTPFWAQESVARELGLESENVHVITPFVGGGFGGKSRNQQVIEAARLAKLSGRPVMVAWSREEEFFYDTFRPAAIIKVQSGIDASNRIAYWDYDNYFAGARSSEPIYDIPHYRVRARGTWRGGSPAHPFGVGAWRGPGSNTNVFAMESQTDIMAEAAGVDPLAFRLNNLADERMKSVLQAAADRFDHLFSRSPSGNGYGIACTNYHETYVAVMAEVDVDPDTGMIQVNRVVCAQDMGRVVNPEGARLQIEGCITMGLGYSLSEKIRFSGGRILDRNFDTYQLPRLSWLPAIETVLVDNPEEPPRGGGEPAITAMGAALANAVHDATGARIHELPMTPEVILASTNRR